MRYHLTNDLPVDPPPAASTLPCPGTTLQSAPPAGRLGTLLLGVVALMGLFAGPLYAQDASWYRVELMVFTQGGAAALRQEYWDPEPLLSYPSRYRFLINQQLVARRAAQHPGQYSHIDAIGRQIIDDKAPAPGPVAASSDATGSGSSSGSSSGSGSGSIAATGAAPEPFVLLPASEREFRGTSYMQSKGGYDILFHQSWLQPVVSRNQARSIILDDSGAEQRYPPLQGSITIFNDRYLALETKLWLNTNGSYLQSGWQIPSPPLSPISLIVDDEADDPERPSEDVTIPYPFRHAIAVNETRRMRSGEIHYLDHPVLGIVIKLTRLDAAQEQDEDDEAQLELESAVSN